MTVTGKIKKNVMRDITDELISKNDASVVVLGHKK
jgi:hypothetical protein